jgi:hypothetical protein
LIQPAAPHRNRSGVLFLRAKELVAEHALDHPEV